MTKQRPPLAVAALGVLAIVFFALPFVGLLWRAPWSDLAHILWRHDSGSTGYWAMNGAMLVSAPILGAVP